MQPMRHEGTLDHAGYTRDYEDGGSVPARPGRAVGAGPSMAPTTVR